MIGCEPSPTGYFGPITPEPAALPRLLEALRKEDSEFVRPALTRAIAAYGSDPKVREVMTGLVMRGQRFFRGAVIEAVGDFKGTYAFAPLTEIAKLDGPLQDDAVLALESWVTSERWRRLRPCSARRRGIRQPSIATAICLIGVNCRSHRDI